MSTASVRTIWFWAGWLWAASCFAQPDSVRFEHVTSTHELEEASITAIFQDRTGFMWFGTANGVVRYDGYTFKSFRADSAHPDRSFSGNLVFAMDEDQSGKLWIGTTDGGLNQFDPVRERFTHYVHQPNEAGSLLSNHVSAVLVDRRGTLWVGYGGGVGGISRFNPSTRKFIHYQHQPDNPASLSEGTVTAIYEDRSGVLWVGTSKNGLHQFHRETGTFTHYGTPDLLNNSVGAIFEDRQDRLWVGGRGGTLHQFNRQTGTFTRFPNATPGVNASDPLNVITSVCEDTRGKLWVAMFTNGLHQFDPTTGTYTHFRHQPGNPASIADNTIFSVYADRSGIIWVGTFGAGIDKVDQVAGRFTQFAQQASSAKTRGLSSNNVSALGVGKNGVLWVGTSDGGLNRVNLQTGYVTHYQHQPGNPNSLSGNAIRSVWEDRQGLLWIGSYANGLDCYNPATNQFTHYKKNDDDSTSLRDNAVLTIYEDRSGTLWLTAEAGLSKLDRTTSTFTHYPNSQYTEVAGNETEVMLEDRKGILWVGGGSGLHQFNRQTGRFTHYAVDTSGPAVAVPVHALLEDRRGWLWIGTGGGLYGVDPKRKLRRHYDTKDGLPSQYVAGIEEDDAGNLWLSTRKGLSRFSPRTATFRNYNRYDGLPGNEFTPSHGKLPTGEMAFGSSKGVILFHPSSLRDSPYQPPVVLTDFQVFNQSVPVHPTEKAAFALPESITTLKELTLPPHVNVFSLEFAALDFTRPEKNQYAYRLEGFDDDWIQAGTRRLVTYTNLDAGTYTFRVKGTNHDGVWNEQAQTLRIVILPPWWRTWWAYALYGLCLMGLLYAGWRYSINRERMRNDLRLKQLEAEKLQELDTAKTRFFTNVSHEFRTPLTLLLGPLEELLAPARTEPETNRRLYRMMQRQTHRLLRLINQLLELARLDAGKVRLQARKQDLIPHLRGLIFSFSSLADTRRVDLQFNAQTNNLAVYYDPDKLEKIINNLLSNAFKFTPEGGSIAVSVAEELSDDSSWVIIQIEDSGTGIAKEDLPRIFDRFYQSSAATNGQSDYRYSGSGIGLALTRELVELHHGIISVTSETGQGSRFVVRLPLGSNHLKDDEVVSEEANLPPPDDALPVTPEMETEERVIPSVSFSEETPLLLIVEDNADVRQFIESIFSGEYRIRSAADGGKGWQLALQTIPDLIIADWMMPGMDGLELCQRLKTDERTSHIPVILLTAKATTESKLAGLETGADDYLTKPFYPFELKTRVKNLVDNRRKLRERFSRELIVQPRQVVVTSADERFLQRAMAIVEQHLADSDFSVEAFAGEIGMSRMQLHRKLKALTGEAPSDFIRVFRLKRAAQLLKQQWGNVAEVAYAVGFENLPYFTQSFKQYFGATPTAYVKAGE